MEENSLIVTSKLKLKNVVDNGIYTSELVAKNIFSITKEDYSKLWEPICILVDHYIEDYLEVNICELVEVDLKITINNRVFRVHIGLPKQNINSISTYQPVVDLNKEIEEFLK